MMERLFLTGLGYDLFIMPTKYAACFFEVRASASAAAASGVSGVGRSRSTSENRRTVVGRTKRIGGLDPRLRSRSDRARRARRAPRSS